MTTKVFPLGWPEGKKFLELTSEERSEVRRLNPPEIDYLCSTNVYFGWGWTGCGFGQLSFSLDSEKSVLECSNECMGRDSIRALLHSYADYIADRVILLDNPGDIPPKDFYAEVMEAKKQRAEQRAGRLKRKSNGDV